MEQAEIVVDVETSPLSQSMQHEIPSLSQSMQQKLNKLWSKPDMAENFTIFRVPRNIRESKRDLFEPSVVSIGPFHHGNTSLRAMEEKKWRFLGDFLSRGDRLTLDLCISEMKQLEERARRCYNETVDLDSDDFVEMMLLDGCFVLEYFRNESSSDVTNSDAGWSSMYILQDLLLLENQIPFFIVEKLCEISSEQDDRRNFYNDIVHVMKQGPTSDMFNPNPPAAIHHLVHFYHHCSVPNPENPVVSSSKSFDLSRMLRMLNPSRIKDLFLGFLLCFLTKRNPIACSRSLSLTFRNATGYRSLVVIPCATELQDAGVKFKPKSNPRNMFDISFHHGVLEIPRLTISDDSKPLLVNLLAFEQCMLGEMSTAHLSSFLIFMDSLVSTQSDVMILQQCGIIENCLTSEEEMACFFNQSCQGSLIQDDHFLAELFAEVNRYCESNWNRHRAKLIRDYFSSPWAMISLVAALVLLVLTCVQSFFAVYAYYVPPKQRT